ncbi:MAG: hypothetical protein IPO32_17275 [Crocinitomicaceae bacterium]|jgi:hypothetical protein|nr:hypothetical protein [Crocinitomicaceae bacterium]MBK9593168.1 hypothetical protein [Crocinitomicaceae bacterium]
MKKVLFILFLQISFSASSQLLNPQTLSISYYGESIAHPGLKIGVDYDLKNWQTNKTKKSSESITKQKSLVLSPTLGFYRHKAYQTGLFILPELKYNREKPNGNFFQTGIGLGYMRTFLPDVYRLNPAGEIEKIGAGYNYMVGTLFATFGKKITQINEKPLSVYAKPQLMYAAPNYAGGILYFNLEMGLQFEL